MIFGNRVRCSAYIKPSGNHYEITPAEDTEDGACYCAYWPGGADEGVDVDDFHGCERFKTVEADFSGIFVGTTVLCTQLNAEYIDDLYARPGYRTYCDHPERFAVVYYASNRKRLVPLDRIREECTE